MSDIRYVCISDTHFGSSGSLLTNLHDNGLGVDPTMASPVLKKLVLSLREIIGNQEEKPYLILNGDILELALATEKQSAMAFFRFIELAFPENGDQLFNNDTIFYVPGNHDHHLWETARESQYVDYIMSQDTKKELPDAWHTTKLFVGPGRPVNQDTLPVPVFFLTKLIQRYKHLQNIKITAAYPNLGLITKSREKCIVFHHGHFTESIYSAISQLQTMIFPERTLPKHVYELEADNFAWIDFLWSTLGRSGDAGTDIKALYDIALDKEAMRTPIRNLARAIAERFDMLPDWADLLPGKWADSAEAFINEMLLKLVVDKIAALERNVGDTDISALSGDWLKWYVEDLLKEQILSELDDGGTLNAVLPGDVTFVFGHTHKPMEREMEFSSYPNKVKIYNTGGWIFEHPVPRKFIGGAVVLADEDLNVVSLRMYDELGARAKVCEVRKGERCDLFDEVSQVVATSEIFASFTDTVKSQIEDRINIMNWQRQSSPFNVIG